MTRTITPKTKQSWLLTHRLTPPLSSVLPSCSIAFDFFGSVSLLYLSRGEMLAVLPSHPTYSNKIIGGACWERNGAIISSNAAFFPQETGEVPAETIPPPPWQLKFVAGWNSCCRLASLVHTSWLLLASYSTTYLARWLVLRNNDDY